MSGLRNWVVWSLYDGSGTPLKIGRTLVINVIASTMTALITAIMTG